MKSQSLPGETFLDELSDDHGRKLKEMAMASIGAILTGEIYRPDASDPLLREKAGVFVTLKRDGYLRGCVGYILPIYEIWDSTRRASIHAAFSDPRFGPVQKSELSHLDVEISVLGPLEEMKIAEAKDLDILKLGKDGLMVVGKGTSGLLLPQVATESGFTAIEFLEATCEKAGLEPEAWRFDTLTIYKFQARIF